MEIEISYGTILFMKNIDLDIKNGQFKNVYLIYGSERYLVNQYKKKLLQALVQEGDTMNFSSYEGKDINPNEIIDMAQTLPFFADYRVLLIENSGFFKKSCEELSEYMNEIPESTIFIFVESEVDSRLKMTKAVAKNGYVACIDTVDEATLQKWVLGRIRKEGKNITEQAYHDFIDRTGVDMSNIDSELVKLLSYCQYKDSISQEDVKAVVIEQTVNKVFDMVEHLAMKRQKEALQLYYQLLELNEAPMRILYQISRHFQILMVVKLMTGKGYGNREIAAKVGCREWAVKKYQNQARAYSLEQLKKAVREGVDYETAVKTGRMNDQLAVEVFLMSLN